MTPWTPPLRDTMFVLEKLLGVGGRDDTPQLAAVDGDLLEAVVGEAGRFCAEVVAPLNLVSDREGCTRHDDGSVSTPSGFREAYRKVVEAGWITLVQPEEFGGQGMPHVLSAVIEEYMNSACAGFMMYPGIMPGAVTTVNSTATPELKQEYLPRMVSGEWLATMALTEAHAGTDLGLMRTRAEPRGNGTYAISGQKIFISGGEHDLTDNIVHLVLARVPGAPDGSRGISLFLVPKLLPDGERNSLSCGSIEHKMGLNGSATCVMNFDEATGFMLGQENMGLAGMFLMMNAARLGVGAQGLAHAENAYQKGVAYAIDRKQGRGTRKSEHAADPLLVHADVRRMLMDAKAFTEGFRALVLWTALQIDLAHGLADAAERKAADDLVSFLTPVIKAFGTDRGFETAVAMQQVYGGHGYVKEWGMEQIVRDARICMIYEGANGVQALDLAGRKLARDGGEVCERFLALIESACADCAEELRWISGPLREGVHETREAATWLVSEGQDDPDALGAGSYAFMQMIGTAAIGWMWLRMAALAASEPDNAFLAAKLVTARHYAERTLPDCGALRRKVEAGAATLMALDAEQFERA
ncbi:acyl-CoA dehydrogenase C-terminal domain-containing protein [Tsuneonella sp. HG222]